MSEGYIRIKDACVNNLKHVSLDIPRGKLVVITGVSGSGKSSLAFDTLFAEGQRRFAQSLSSYARQFLGRMSKPDVESIEGMPPAVAIQQKVSIKNPRSTLATTSELYDYIRILFARLGKTYSPISGGLVHADTEADVLAWIGEHIDGEPFYLLCRPDWGSDSILTLLSLKEQGFSRLWADSSVLYIDDALQQKLDVSSSYLLLDRFRDLEDKTRVLASLETAFSQGRDEIFIYKSGEYKRFCKRFELDGILFRQSDDFLFNFNSPLGACPVCAGLGMTSGISEDLVVPDKSLSIYEGAVACWRGEKMSYFKNRFILYAEQNGVDIFTPYCQLPDEQKEKLWTLESRTEEGAIGINQFFKWVESQRVKVQFRYMLSRFSGRSICYSCHGSRLRKEALYVKLQGKTIAEVLAQTVDESLDFFRNLQLDENGRKIAQEPLSEVLSRLECLQDVGLGYLTLNRSCNTLSGGESQRINLVSAIGSNLTGSMYVLDEPSVGLHYKDTARLVKVLRRLRDLGNTVIVVEHDEDIIRAADQLIDIGPKAGELGGQVVFQGVYSPELPQSDIDRSLTLQYLSGQRSRYVPPKRNWNYSITLKGAMEHNLKDLDVQFPLGVLTVVSGVSGSGKSTLVGDVLYPALLRHIEGEGPQPGAHRGLEGNLDRIQAVEYVDQNPIGRSSRSNPVTYLKVYDLIRKLLSDQPYARTSGYGPSFFSFNQDGGRCSECMGEGYVKIGMQFLSDVRMVCTECGGKRFKPDILEVKYRGLNVNDILDLTIAGAQEFFSKGKEPEAQEIARRLQPLVDVGLDYLRLGQSSSTLSGGESQRVKLAYFLSQSSEKSLHKRTLFIFDEPTTGLHFYDIEKLLKSFDALIAKGHSVLVVEHNKDMIKAADWLIELGPGAGSEGGRVVFSGPASAD